MIPVETMNYSIILILVVLQTKKGLLNANNIIYNHKYLFFIIYRSIGNLFELIDFLIFFFFNYRKYSSSFIGKHISYILS